MLYPTRRVYLFNEHTCIHTHTKNHIFKYAYTYMYAPLSFSDVCLPLIFDLSLQKILVLLPTLTCLFLYIFPI